MMVMNDILLARQIAGERQRAAREHELARRARAVQGDEQPSQRIKISWGRSVSMQTTPCEMHNP